MKHTQGSLRVGAQVESKYGLLNVFYKEMMPR